MSCCSQWQSSMSDLRPETFLAWRALASNTVKPRAANNSNEGIHYSTAGPFDLYGTKLVAACVRHATHYVDITGETPWMQYPIAQHHARDQVEGTLIIPCCGFDSIPSDLGTWMMVQAMRERHGVDCVAVKAAFSMRGGLNGGTLASALNMLGKGESERMADPFLLNPPETRPIDVQRHADPVLPRVAPCCPVWTRT